MTKKTDPNQNAQLLGRAANESTVPRHPTRPPAGRARRVELVEKQLAHQGYFSTHLYLLSHELFDGSMGEVIDREVMDRGDVVGVLPIDPIRDEVVMVEQFRPGAYAAGWAPWLLECVAGVVETGETPEAVARREAVEEAGCEVTHLELVAHYLSSPGSSTEKMSVFCGRTSTENVGGVHGLAEEGENILVHVLSVDEALDLLARGEIGNAKTIIVLQWLAAHYERLKRVWTD